jgi:6-pyruvoyltetrahydropterin/6-carboxytetrahydropterin synthase
MRVGIFEYMDCAHSLKALDGGETLHGHTYKAEVVVQGVLQGGMVIDFKALRELTKACMAKYDHKNLSEFFEVPSCENICQALFDDIKKLQPGLVSVKLWEGHNKWSEVLA